MSKAAAMISLMRLDKPIGIYLCLWPTLWALWLASSGLPNWNLLAIMIAGSVLLRSAGCVINDFWDRDVDQHVDRTANRPITSGVISPAEALMLFAVLAGIALLLTFFLNKLAIEIALAAGVLTILYPLAKRVTYFPQVILGLTFNSGILIAFASTQNRVPFIAIALYLTAVLWTVAYDTIYAMADKPDDEKLQLKSTAIYFANYGKLAVAILQIFVLLSFCAIGFWFQLRPIYFYSIVICGLCFHHQLYLIHQGSRTLMTQAFLQNHWVGATIFLAIVLNYC